MRADMFKVIVERPRLRFPLRCGSAYPRGRLANLFERDLESAPLGRSDVFAVALREPGKRELARATSGTASRSKRSRG
jgi:hypothetical protein